MYCPLYNVNYTLDTVSKIGIGKYTRDEWMDVGEISRSPDLQISRSPDLQISTSPDLHISRPPHLQISPSPGLPMSTAPSTLYTVHCVSEIER